MKTITYLLVKHKVKDLSKWESGFDQYSSIRKDAGSKGGMLFHTLSDPNEVVIIFEWDNLENARKFNESEELKAKMEEMGVVGDPGVFFLDKIEDVQF